MTRAVSPNQNPINISTILTYFTELQYTHTDHTIPEMRKLRAYPVNQSLYRSHILSVSPTREIFTPKWRLQLRASASLTRNFLCNIHTRRRSISRNFTRNSNSDKSSIYNTHTAAKEIHISRFYTSRRCFSFFYGRILHTARHRRYKARVYGRRRRRIFVSDSCGESFISVGSLGAVKWT